MRLRWFALLLMPCFAHGQTRTETVDGERLSVVSHCVRSVTVKPGTGPAGKVAITVTAATADELASVTHADFDGAALIEAGPRTCPHNPTLDLSLVTPSGMPVAIRSTGSAQIALGAMGAVTIDLAGAGSLKLDSATALTLASSGSTSVLVDHLTGPLDVSLAGSGNLVVRAIEAPKAALDLRGSGTADIGLGQIGSLAISVAGSGSAKVTASVHDASLSVAGSGTIDVSQVTGSLSQSSAGSGQIRIGAR